MNYDFNKKNLLAVTALMTGGPSSLAETVRRTASNEESEAAIVRAPAFNADSAYAYIAAQVQFGPSCSQYGSSPEMRRLPGNTQLEKFGCEGVQPACRFGGLQWYPSLLKSFNIIGLTSRKTKSEDAVRAHWDN